MNDDTSPHLHGSPSEKRSPGAPCGRFEGREQFQDWVRQALSAAATEGWREIILCDGDFRDWPLGERAVQELLNEWASGVRAQKARKCTILAANFDAVRIHHPRFAEWRNRWSHLIECRQLSVKDPLDAPSVIWSERWVMQRVDVERVRGVASSDAQNGIAWREKLREWITSRSKTGFPTTILGL